MSDGSVYLVAMTAEGSVPGGSDGTQPLPHLRTTERQTALKLGNGNKEMARTAFARHGTICDII